MDATKLHWGLVIGTSSVIKTPSLQFVIGMYLLSEQFWVSIMSMSSVSEHVLIPNINRSIYWNNHFVTIMNRTHYRNSDNETLVCSFNMEEGGCCLKRLRYTSLGNRLYQTQVSNCKLRFSHMKMIFHNCIFMKYICISRQMLRVKYRESLNWFRFKFRLR